MNMIDDMTIGGNAYNDSEYRNTSLSGWLVFFIVCQIIGILSTILSIWFNPAHSTIAKFIFSLAVILPASAVAALCKRLRDAVFLSLASVISALLVNTVNFAILTSVLSDHATPFLIGQGIGGFASGIAWILYLVLSKRVKIRFPLAERAIRWYDIAVAVGCFILSMTYAISSVNDSDAEPSLWEKKEITELKKYTYQLDRLDPKNLKFESLEFRQKECIAIFRVRNARSESLARLRYRLNSATFLQGMKNALIDNAPVFLQLVTEDGGDLRLMFYRDDIGDGAQIVLSNKELRDMQNIKPQVADMGVLEYPDEQLMAMMEQIEELWPGPYSDAIYLNGKDLREGILTYRFIVDESKESFASVDDGFAHFVGKCCARLLDLKDEGNDLVEEFSRTDLEIKVELKGSRTGYKKEYFMMSTSELRD